MRLNPLVVAVIVGLLLASPGGRPAGQSLGEVARQEAERRKSMATGSKVYTNKDLPEVPPATAPAPKAEAPAAAGTSPEATAKEAAPTAPGASTAKAPEAERLVRDQEYWAGRIKNLRDILARDETYLEALQSRINALTTDFVNRDDPAQRAVIASDRQRALDEFDRLKIQIEADRKAIVDFEQEARRASVPPGWLR
jgi:hypothetical protein